MTAEFRGAGTGDAVIDRPWLRPYGRTRLTVSAVTAGGGPLGSMPEMFGYDVAAEDAIDLVLRLFDSPIRVIDTANIYSGGESERRIGEAIRRRGGVPDDFLIATKVDGKDGDYSGERVRRSIEESQSRLGMEFLPLVYLHDPEYAAPDQGLDEPGGAVDVLVELQKEGVIGHIGVAGGDTAVMRRFASLGVFEAVLTHNRFTLVDRSADPLIDLAVSQGAGVANAAYLGGGILANPAGPRMYGYKPIAAETLTAVEAIDDVCHRYGIPIATAALRFSLRDPRITTSVVGISKPSRIDAVAAAVEAEIPEAFWDEVEALAPPASVWLDAAARRDAP